MTDSKPRLIRSPEDAELAARDWLRSHGFLDAEVTSKGPDSGVDVVSRDLVAQVKAEMVPTGRPVVQAISGIAVHVSKRAALFTLAGATAQAMEFATSAGVAVFRFDLQGLPKPQNPPARELQRQSGTSEGRPTVVLGEVGQLLVDQIEAARTKRQNLIVSGFAPDTDPLFGQEVPGRDDGEFAAREATGRLKNMYLPEYDHLESRPDSLRALNLGAIALVVRWVNPDPPVPPQPVAPLRESAFDHEVVWEPSFDESLHDPGVWEFPTIRVESPSEEVGGRDHHRLCGAVGCALQSRKLYLSFGATQAEWWEFFDLREPGQVQNVVSYVEAALKGEGSSVERLHWWAFHSDPQSTDGSVVNVDLSDGYAVLTSEADIADLVAAVDRARLWPVTMLPRVDPVPPEAWTVTIPHNLAAEATDEAVDLLARLEGLGVHVQTRQSDARSP